MRSPVHSPAAGAGRGGGRHSGRAILTGPAAPGSGARRAHGQRANSPGLLTPGRASHGRRQRALGVGAAPLPRVSGARGCQLWGTNFAGNLRGSGAARARMVETDTGRPRLSGPASSGSQGPRGPRPSRARPVLWTRAQRKRGETGLGDRQTSRGREGRTRAESPRRLSLGSWSLLSFFCRGGPARLGTVPGRGNLDCRVQLLRVEAAEARNPLGTRT